MEETTVRTKSISIEQEMRQSYLDYAMSVIIGRALPDVRDGLKPVHRRILFAMHELKNDWNKPYKKSARVVGDVIGKYHPHGDSAVYDAIVRLAQDFSMRCMLVDGQGNFGSVDGDSPAAMRYTEVRMARISHQMLADIDKETVDFSNNYDESLLEPTVLPTKVPALLVNGSSGIAVGMATNIPPHNLGEVCDAITAVIDNPDITVYELMALIPGPDFPTSGIIHGSQGIYSAYTTGRGSIKIRAQVAVEKDQKGQDDTIVVTELPYQVNKANLIEKIADLAKNKVIDGIRYVRDESDKDGMRIAIGLKRQQFAEVVINQLYKHTRLEHSFGVNMLAVVNNRPEVLTLKEIIEYVILHRQEIIIRRTRFDLKKAEDRAHILEGLKIAIDNLDEVVALIRKAASPAEAKEGLIERFTLTPIQAQAILDMRLQKLTGLEREKIISEYQEVLKQIAYYKEILASETMVLDLIKQELTELKETFGDERRTRIIEEASREINPEDLIAEEDMVITVSRTGYIKRNPISLYRKQIRGGKGKTAMGTKENDFVDRLFVASTHHTFLFFTNRGKVYWRKVYEIPQAGRTSRGTALVNLLELEEGEKLTTILNVPEFTPGFYILKATRNGMVKKTDIMAYSRPRTGGIIALDLADDDELIAARITDGSWNVFLGAAGGKSVRFLESDVRSTGRISRGVRGIRLDPGDQLVSMEVLSHGKTLLTITENGYGKRTSIDEYPIKKRGGKGVITIKTSVRNGLVVSSLLVEDDDEVMIMTDAGKIIRISVSGVSVISRNTQGVKLIGLDDNEAVTGAARLAEGGDAEEENGPGHEGPMVDGDTHE